MIKKLKINVLNHPMIPIVMIKLFLNMIGPLNVKSVVKHTNIKMGLSITLFQNMALIANKCSWNYHQNQKCRKF